jgi:hypothetical protein
MSHYSDGYVSSGSRYRDRETYVLPRPSRIRSSQHRWHPGAWIASILVLAILAGLFAWFYSYEYGTETSVVFTVKALDDQATGNNGHQYLVFTDVPGTTTAAEVFKDTDAWFHGKWNSSNLFNYLTVGKTYRCTVYGVRNGVFSSYRNALVCSPLTLAQAQQYRGEWVKPVGS